MCAVFAEINKREGEEGCPRQTPEENSTEHVKLIAAACAQLAGVDHSRADSAADSAALFSEAQTRAAGSAQYLPVD